MTNYSDNPADCRVDFFKENGKWYTTESVRFPAEFYDKMPDSRYRHPIEKFAMILDKHLKGRLKGMWAICLDPYFEDSFPLMIKIPE